MLDVAQVTDLVHNGVAATAVATVNLIAITGVFVQGWRHRVASLQEVNKVGHKVAALEVTLKNHIVNTPTHEVCMGRMAQIENVVRAETRLVRDDVQAMTIERNGTVAKNEMRIHDLEYWRDRMTPDREDKVDP